jgi:hypothetical protein
MNPLTAESVLRYFEQANAITFVDSQNGVPVLALIEQWKNVTEPGFADYELWFSQPDDASQFTHHMEAL